LGDEGRVSGIFNFRKSRSVSWLMFFSCPVSTEGVFFSELMSNEEGAEVFSGAVITSL
jgi:hypothetical protein